MKINYNKHGKYWRVKNPIAKHVRYAVKKQSAEYPIAVLTIESNHENAVGKLGGPIENESQCWESMRFSSKSGKLPSIGGR